jgi:hypothetical protein
MARVTVAILLTHIYVSALAADAPSLLVRTRLEPATVAIGQPATLYVDTYTSLFFTSAIDLPALSIPGAIVKLSDDRPSHTSTDVNGASWPGIGRKYTITPLVAADLAVPAFEVATKIGPQMQAASSRTKAFTLHVSVPEGAEGAFVTHDLRMTQTTDVDPATLKVGDAFTRTVTLIATGTPAMFVPDVQLGESEGLKAYPSSPVLADAAPDQPVRGTRTFAVNYVVQQPGDLDLPGIEVRWWDLDTKQLETAQVPALHVHAIAAPLPPPPFSVPAEQQAPAPEESIDWRKLLLYGAALVALIVILLWLRPYVVRLLRSWLLWLRRRRAAYLQSERHAFRQLQVALGAGQPEAIPSALYHWLDRLPADSTASAARATSAANEDPFSRACSGLLDAYYGQSGLHESRSAQAVNDQLRRKRRASLHDAQQHGAGTRLPVLNP